MPSARINRPENEGNQEAPKGPEPQEVPEAAKDTPFFVSKPVKKPKGKKIEDAAPATPIASAPSTPPPAPSPVPKPPVEANQEEPVNIRIEHSSRVKDSFALIIDGLTQRDLDIIATIGYYLQMEQIIPFGHPGYTVKYAINLLVAKVHEDLDAKTHQT